MESHVAFIPPPKFDQKNGLGAKPQDGWVANRPSVWVGRVNHFCPFPTPGPWKLATQQLVLRFSFSSSRKEEWPAFRVTSGEDFCGILPRRFLTSKPQGTPGTPGALQAPSCPQH